MVDQPTEPPPPPQLVLLQFPTDYPIKVVGRPSDGFRARVHAVMLRHAPQLDPDLVKERQSDARNFLSISYMIVAESSDQVIALVNDLKATEGVLTIL
jgi:putative lipoic acid-binding regulatory protein